MIIFSQTILPSIKCIFTIMWSIWIPIICNRIDHEPISWTKTDLKIPLLMTKEINVKQFDYGSHSKFYHCIYLYIYMFLLYYEGKTKQPFTTLYGNLNTKMRSFKLNYLQWLDITPIHYTVCFSYSIVYERVYRWKEN